VARLNKKKFCQLFEIIEPLGEPNFFPPQLSAYNLVVPGYEENIAPFPVSATKRA
jgi:hypothetical protein